MTSVKAILRKSKPNDDGTCPIAVQVIQDRIPKVTHIGESVLPVHWDETARQVKRSHADYQRINAVILLKTAEVTTTLLQEKPASKAPSTASEPAPETIKAPSSSVVVAPVVPAAAIIVPAEHVTPVIQHPSSLPSSFFTQADSFIAYLRACKKFGQYSNDKSVVDRFKQFLNRDFAFEEISVGLLLRFQAYLKNIKTRTGEFISERSIMNHFVVIRSVYAHAKLNKVVIPSEHYPFGKGGFKIKFPETSKIGLNADEVKLLITADLSGRQVFHHARNLWLFSYYFAGMRAADVLQTKWQDIRDGRLHYIMNKNGKEDSLKIPDPAMDIIEQYRRPAPKHDLVFPELEGVEDINDEWEVKRRIKSRLRDIDERLRTIAAELGIDKKLTMHIARHTFGNLAGDKISIQKLQKLYRHSHISTTVNYQQNFIHADTDEALEAVLSTTC